MRPTSLLALLLLSITPALADPLSKDAARCQKEIGKQGRTFKAKYLEVWQACLDRELQGKPCDAAARDAAVAKARTKAIAGIGKRCSAEELFAVAPDGIGFGATCALKPEPLSDEERACVALVTTTPNELGACVTCWKMSELNALLETLYPCRADGIPGGSLADCPQTAPTCPPPGDKDTVRCLRGIASAGIDLFLAREAALEICLDGVRAGKVASCPDAKAVKAITEAEAKAAKRLARCEALPPWWSACPDDPTPPCGLDTACDRPIGSVSDVGACVSSAATELADEVVCQQYPGAAGNGLACQTAPLACCGDDERNGDAEQCDGADSAGCGAGYTCRDDCTCETCGDGVVQAPEQCEPIAGAAPCPGNNPCLANCQCPGVPAVCGDGTLDAGEDCDPGINPPAPGSSCAAGLDRSCPLDCQCTCGNGASDPGEQCDPTDPNTPPCPNGAACLADCLCECGNGTLDAGEECDPARPANPECGATTCEADCRCGYGCLNKRKDPIEDCDPSDPDLADQVCEVGVCTDCQCLCGNGAKDAGEACDATAETPGNLCEGGACIACECVPGATTTTTTATSTTTTSLPPCETCEEADDCDDADACTNEGCIQRLGDGQFCCSRSPVAVDDGDECTEDSCDPGTGVVTHLPIPDCGTSTTTVTTVPPTTTSTSPSSGACCFGDGSCADGFGAGSCLEAGGTPQSPESTCDTTTCPQPIEGCCLPDGACADFSGLDCFAAGGIPQGTGTSCATTFCPQPTEGCCFPDGGCADLIGVECAISGGLTQGIGSSCATTFCPTPSSSTTTTTSTSTSSSVPDDDTNTTIRVTPTPGVVGEASGEAS